MSRRRSTRGRYRCLACGDKRKSHPLHPHDDETVARKVRHECVAGSRVSKKGKRMGGCKCKQFVEAGA